MAPDWTETTLGALGPVVTGKTPSTGVAENFGGDVPFITPSDMNGARYIRRTARHLSRVGVASVKGSQIPAGAVLVSCIGSDMGKAAIAPVASVTNQQINSLIVQPPNWGLYVYYDLSQRKSEIRAGAGGSAQPILNKSSFSRLPISLPSPARQRAIADLLNALDNKIEANYEVVGVLEEIARALFKSWFVDFDPVRAKAEGRQPFGMDATTAALFPEKFEDSELGEIPKGWSVRALGDLATRVAMGPFGSDIKVETFVSEGVPVISGQHLHNTLLTDSDFRFITKEHADRLANANVERGDVILTHAGTIGQVAYVPKHSEFERYIISQRQFFFRCDAALISPRFLVYYFKSAEGRHRLLANASSTGVPSLARPVSYLRTIRITVPPPPIMTAFDALVTAMHDRFEANTQETRALAELRDYLLPKLLSGEIRVKEAEHLLEQTP